MILLPAIGRSREFATWKDDLVNYIAGGIFMLIGIILLMSHSKKVLFDDQSMYIVTKRSEIVIPLAAITHIKLTSTTVGQARFVWKIIYRNELYEEKIVRILPKRQLFEEFKEKVKEKNAQVEIRNWSHPFADQ